VRQPTVVPRDPYGEQLVGWEKAVAIETLGRVTGRTVVATVGFVEELDGSLLVAAGDPGAHWAANLRAEPRCVARIGIRRAAYVANELDDAAKARAVTALILKYGTPAERLGAGPAFRLQPAQ
jgi:deazaflavin-dependent oxidoreductase (nitroreductase family)